jgi:hypothetical protein
MICTQEEKVDFGFEVLKLDTDMSLTIFNRCNSYLESRVQGESSKLLQISTLLKDLIRHV